METEDLSEEEKSAFKSLSRDLVPPDSLEDDVVTELKAKGLIQSSGKKKLRRFLYPIAASLLFLLGFFLGQEKEGISDNDFGYMLILSEDENFDIQSQNPGDIADEYGVWMEKINESNIAMVGQELWNEAHQVTQDGVEFLNADHQNRITGYFLIEAVTEEEAITLARESPHVKYGGKVQLKKFRVR